MIFQGIAPQLRSVDPKFLRFELSLNWLYIAARFTEFNICITETFAKLGPSMQKATEQMQRAFKIFNQK